MFSIGSEVHKSLLVTSINCFFHSQEYLDVIFICSGAEEIKAHKIVIASASEFLKNIVLAEKHEKAYISLPDINSKIFKLVLEYLYNGIAKVDPKDLDDFNNLMNILGISMTNVSTKRIDTSQTVLEQKLEKRSVLENTQRGEVSNKINHHGILTANDKHAEEIQHNGASDGIFVKTEKTLEQKSENVLHESPRKPATFVKEEKNNFGNSNDIDVVYEEDNSTFGEERMGGVENGEHLSVCKECGVIFKSSSTAEGSKLVCANCAVSRSHCIGYEAQSSDCDMENTGNERANYDVGFRLFQCSMCKKTFGSEQSVTRHKIKVHSYRDHKCDQCQKSFKTAAHLNRHMLVHSNVREHQCTECNMLFKRREHLYRHMFLHTGQTLYQCHLCDKRYYRADSYKNHVITRHELFDFTFNDTIT